MTENCSVLFFLAILINVILGARKRHRAMIFPKSLRTSIDARGTKVQYVGFRVYILGRVSKDLH